MQKASIFRSINILSIYLVVICMPYSIMLANATIGFFFISAVVFAISKKDFDFNYWKYFLLFSSPFLLMFFSLTYTEDVNYGWSIIEKTISIILFPLGFLFCRKNLDQNKIRNIILVFIINSWLLSLIILLHLYKKFSLEDLYAIKSYSNIFREAAENLIDMHATYISLYILFGILLSICYCLLNKITFTSILFFILGGTISLSISVILASRMPLIAFMITVIYITIFYIKNTKATVSLTILLLTAVLLMWNVRAVKLRINELINTKLTPPIGLAHNSTNIRVGIYLCSTELIREHWIWGVGIGDVQNQLNNCYSKFDTNVYQLRDYNSHNQYLNFWMSSGIFGIMAWLFALFLPFKSASRANIILYITFLLFMMVCCLTENILMRQKGVVFYSYFNSLFGIYYLKMK